MDKATKIVAHKLLSSQNSQVAALKEYIFKDDSVTARIKSDMDNAPSKKDFFVVFISVCNTKNRAIVIKGIGTTLDLAWNNADRNIAEIIAKNEYDKDYDIVWAKADIVNYAEEIPTVDLNKEIVKEYYQYFYRNGIAFDENFDIAFLEAEINGNKMITYYTETQVAGKQINYDSVLLNLININNYRKLYYDREPIKSVPQKITVFTTLGFFCGEDEKVYELYVKGFDCGRRIIDLVDGEVIETAIIKASKYLYELIQPDGEFIYGYYPIFGNQMKNYNILRHTSSLWSLINLYRITNDTALIPKLNSAIKYLTDRYIEYKADDIAYVVERKADEIKLGGNAVAVIMLTEYMDVFGTTEYIDLVRHMANGLLKMEDLSKGTFYHVLSYPDYSQKEEHRTIYYDGEAAFALTRAYTYTKDARYLNGAIMAVENFIAKDYTKHKDHWIAYALHEITKYIPDTRYYEFALRNVGKNLKKIYYQPTSYHTYLELLVTGWQTYKRIIEDNIKLDYLKEFDAEYFAQTIYQRARHMLNGHFYPEYAMYMKYPDKIVNAFCIRHDNFRVRIDDVQHFIGGYYFYTKYYNDILSYLSEEFLSEISKCGKS